MLHGMNARPFVLTPPLADFDGTAASQAVCSSPRVNTTLSLYKSVGSSPVIRDAGGVLIVNTSALIIELNASEVSAAEVVVAATVQTIVLFRGVTPTAAASVHVDVALVLGALVATLKAMLPQHATVTLADARFTRDGWVVPVSTMVLYASDTPASESSLANATATIASVLRVLLDNTAVALIESQLRTFFCFDTLCVAPAISFSLLPMMRVLAGGAHCETRMH